MQISRVAIIGAGLAGLSAARSLAASDIVTRIYDKGRGPGGRLATRRLELAGHPVYFDHGAQYLTSRGRVFGAMLRMVGARPWPEEGRFVGTPRMSNIARSLSDGLDLALSRQVTAIVGEPGAWRVQHLDATLARPGRSLPDVAPAEDGPFDAVLVTAPAPQASELLARPAPRLVDLMQKVVIAPCWTLMAAFDQRPVLPDWQRLEGGPLAWIARDSAKPGREPRQENWIAQAGAAWTREHLELPAEQALPLLLAALAAHAGGSLPPPRLAQAHRWRYALVETALGVPCLWEPALGIGAAGDWCIGRRAEDAVDSGVALAAALRRA
jgi:predicted NAD/FAD-dependent oxidoreductase